MAEPYWTDGAVTLYLGDCREVLPTLGVTADCMVADPPYGDTKLAWDRWPEGWIDVAAAITRSLWCFGSLRMHLAHVAEFTSWKFSQDVIWEKHNGSSFTADRFKRVHEIATHWYRGDWGSIYHETPRIFTGVDPRSRKNVATRASGLDRHHGILEGRLEVDDGTRLMRSVIRVRSMHNLPRLSSTQKPVGLLDPLISYACPPSGLVIDPFAGSGSALDAARCSGRRAIGVEIHEPYAEAAARRLSQGTLIA